MATNKRRNEPQHVSETAWYYEERHGLTVVAEMHNAIGGYIGTVQVKLPIRKLRDSLSRYPAPKRKAKEPTR